MNISIITTAFGMVLIAASGAMAHPTIEAASPAVGGEVGKGPKEVRIRFSEPLVPAFSGLKVSDQKGHVVASGKGVKNVDKRELFLSLPDGLAAGKYQVAWYAVSTDTHHVNGHYGFKVDRQ